MSNMFLNVVYTLCTITAITSAQQFPMTRGNGSGFRDIIGGSIVKLCPESRETDILAFERMVNVPQEPYLDGDIDVWIWGNFTKDLTRSSTVDYQINITANTGDFGSLQDTVHICDYLEMMHQPPRSSEPHYREPPEKKDCPPKQGAVFINYAFWFADWLVAPGQWSVKFDAKTPEGERIYCMEAQFDLQCPPEHDGPECLRDPSDSLNIDWMKKHERYDEL